MELEYDSRHRIEESELDCAVCGHDRVVVGPERTVECPNCEESYALVVREGFTLLSMDGWITRVAFDLGEDLVSAVGG